MLKLEAHHLLYNYMSISQFAQTFHILEGYGQPAQFARSTLQEQRGCAEVVREQCEGLGLVVTESSAADLVKWLDKAIAAQTEPPSPLSPELVHRIKNYLRDVISALRRETETRLFFMITVERRHFYEPKGFLINPEVDVAFESIRYDLTEGGKCLALERSTAAAFHFVRCLEVGLRAIARCLGLPDPDKGRDQSWGKILGAIKGNIDARWPKPADRYEGDGRIFAALYGALAAIKSPYRDDTMHLREIYVEEDARHVFEMMKGLMTRIAARMDEKGEPKLPPLS